MSYRRVVEYIYYIGGKQATQERALEQYKLNKRALRNNDLDEYKVIRVIRKDWKEIKQDEYNE